MKASESSVFLRSEAVAERFANLYGSSSVLTQIERYENLVSHFIERFGDQQIRLFSSPGRSEVSGNHTDHNLGKVIAASIQLDCIGAVAKTDDNIISICDLTYNEDYSVNVDETEVHDGEKGSIALVRGMLQCAKDSGYKIGGFRAVFSSSVIAAAGVSSSASFEMMICFVLNSLYNEKKISVSEMASIGKFAENVYWKKSSGLLDQISCASGGLVTIDFENEKKPEIEKIPFDFSKEGYSLVITNTGKSHADLSEEYSSIPLEMKSVASFFGKSVLREISKEDILNNLEKLRLSCGDRAVMRAFHFFEENKRVEKEVECLKQNDFAGFLQLVKESGNSSWKWLQNVYVASQPKEQSICICLALSELFLKENCSFEDKSKKPGVCRVHGGGFAGVIMTLLPEELTEKYKAFMEKSLGVSQDEKSPVFVMSVRPEGVIEITEGK